MSENYLFVGDSIDITPSRNIPLAGYSGRSGAYRGIDDPLEANALVIKQGERKIVIISADLLYIGKEIHSYLLKKLAPRVRDDELFISATHCHTAPATDDTKSSLGELDKTYVQSLEERISRLVVDLLGRDMKPVRTVYKTGTHPSYSVNRRRKVWIKAIPPRREVLTLPNNRGLKDDKIRLLQLIDRSANTCGIIWNYACHPVFSPDDFSVSADYPGVVRNNVRKQLGTNVPVVFWQGFSGDVNPRVVTTGTAKSMIRPRFRASGREEWESRTKSLADSVVQVVRNDSAEVICTSLFTELRQIPLPTLGVSGTDRSLVLHGVNLGQVEVLGVSAEPVAEYVRLVERVFPNKKVIPVGCLGHVFGYLPSNSMVKESGYEADGFMRFFGVSGRFRQDLQELIESALRSM